MNTYDFKGRVALVTGGARGIGRAAAEKLNACGAAVIVFDRNVDALELPGIAGDVTDAASIGAAVEQIERERGRLDVLVHAAGISGPWQSALELDEADWRQIIEVNATGTFLTCRAALPGMVERGYGRVVLVSSIAGREGNPLIPAYAASKAAVIAFAKSVGRDLAPTGVVVNVVTPAALETGMSLEQTAEIQERMAAAIPLGRMGTEAEAASLIAWMASEECSFSTGAVYDLTGGRAVS